jgi:hypothetical protein
MGRRPTTAEFEMFLTDPDTTVDFYSQVLGFERRLNVATHRRQTWPWNETGWASAPRSASERRTRGIVGRPPASRSVLEVDGVALELEHRATRLQAVAEDRGYAGRVA